LTKTVTSKTQPR